jgi:hypothetical protein
MLYDLFYYILLPITAVTASIGTWCMIYPDHAKSKLAIFSWKFSMFYVECVDLKKQILDKIEDFNSNPEYDSSSDFEDEESECKNDLLYNDKLGNNYITSKFDESTFDKIRDFDPRIMFVRKKIAGDYCYKRTIDPLNFDSEYITLEDKPFIQVEYVTKNKVEKILDIHSNLTGFYVNGNALLDYEFLNWFLPYYYDIEVAKEYEIRVFDKDVNMFTLSSEQYIMIENDSYKIVCGVIPSIEPGDIE